MRRKILLLIMTLGLLAAPGAGPAMARAEDANDKSPTSNACPKDDCTPPDCGNRNSDGNGNGGTGECPDSSHNPGGTPRNCGQCPEGEESVAGDCEPECAAGERRGAACGPDLHR